MSIRAPPFIIDLQRLEVLSSFKELLDIEAELLSLWLMGRVLICSEHLLDNLLLLILRQIILERKVLARLQVVHGVDQAELMLRGAYRLRVRCRCLLIGFHLLFTEQV